MVTDRKVKTYAEISKIAERLHRQKKVIVFTSGCYDLLHCKDDNGSMAACAQREFTEESGIRLERVEALSSEGIPASSRQSNTRYFPFLEHSTNPPTVGPSKLDADEHLKMVLIPLTEWLKLIEAGKVLEDCSIGATYLALRHLGRLCLV